MCGCSPRLVCILKMFRFNKASQDVPGSVEKEMNGALCSFGEFVEKALPSQKKLRALRELVGLSLTLGIAQVGYHLPGFVDTVLAGKVGGETLAATGLGASIFFGLSVFGIGVAMGLDPIVSQNIGAGAENVARAATRQAIYLGALVTSLLGLVLLAAAYFLPLFGIEHSLAERTYDYALGRLPSLWPLFACVAMRSFLQAMHRTMPIWLSVLVLNVLNFGADWILLFGDAGMKTLGLPALGIPAFGVQGIAWSSTAATLGQWLVFFWAMRRLQGSHKKHKWLCVETRLLGQTWELGLPLGLQLVAETAIFVVVGLIVGRIGSDALASHQVALQIAGITFGMALGIGAATSVQVGRAIGRNDVPGMRSAGIAGISFGILFMCCTATIMWLFPNELAQFMTKDSSVWPLASQLVVIAGFFQLVDGVQAVGAGAMRGAGMTQWTFVANVIGHWAIGLPLGLWLGFEKHMGAKGLWWGLGAGLACVAIALSVKFARIRNVKSLAAPLADPSMENPVEKGIC